MSRTFKTADYDATLDVTVRLGDCLPPDHLARFVVDTIAHLDLSALYARYGSRGGQPYAPNILLALLFYGYATGVFSSRKIERATYETVPFRFIAGNLHPDHDTLATFRKTFLPELKDLFVQVLVLAQMAGVLKLGNISLDGTKIHADASKSKAVSYKHLLALQAHLRAEVEELFVLSEHLDQGEMPDGLVLSDEIALRQARLARLAEAKAVLQARAQERTALEQAEYEAKVQERAEKARQTGRTPRGRAPKAPTPGPRDKDQYNFTDPESRIMKHSSTEGFEQDYNAQLAVDQQSLLIVGVSLSNHPTDQHEAEPTLDAIAPDLGTPKAAALDTGYFSEDNIALFERRGIDPHIATGRDPHHPSWWERFAPLPAPPPEDASPKVKMAYKLKTVLGKAIYGLRKCTVEPVIGIIKEVLGFRQFSLRGEQAAAGEWCLVCLAFNLKRLHILLQG
ncbi:MAG: transposase [Roseiflexaceae bacterium]